MYLNWSNLFFFWEIFRENFSKLTVPMGNKITQTDEIGIIIGSMAFLLVILLFVNFIWLSLSNKCQKLPKNHKTHIWSARSKCNQGDWQDLNNIFKTVLQINEHSHWRITCIFPRSQIEFMRLNSSSRSNFDSNDSMNMLMP